MSINLQVGQKLFRKYCDKEIHLHYHALNGKSEQIKVLKCY